MTIDTIKHLGAEFHRAADSLADTLVRLDNARLERLQFLRQCSKDSAAGLAALKEAVRALPEQIAKWDAEAARLESQTAEDLLRQALEPARKCDGDHKGPLCADRQCWLRCPDCGQGEHFSAACGAVVLHPQPPGEVIEAPLTQPKPEPYRAGLPPERLRKVRAEWEVLERGEPDDLLLVFSTDGRLCKWADGREWFAVVEGSTIWDERSMRPHGATWARVEAMADEAEKPTLLDLTKLPPGTVCEATGQIARGSHVILPGERFAFAGSSTEFLARVRVIERDESFDVPTVVYARVVEVPR